MTPSAAADAPSGTPCATPLADTTHSAPAPAGAPGAVARTAPPAPTATASSSSPGPSARASGTRHRRRHPADVHAAGRVRAGVAGPAPAGDRCLCGVHQPWRGVRPAGEVERVHRGDAGHHLRPDLVDRPTRRRGEHVRRQRRHLLQTVGEDDVVPSRTAAGPGHQHVPRPGRERRPGPWRRPWNGRRSQPRPFGQRGDQPRRRRAREPVTETERGPHRGGAGVDPVPAAARDQPGPATGHGEQDTRRLRVRARRRAAQHGGSDQPGPGRRGAHLVADRPARGERSRRIGRDGARDRGGRRARRGGEDVVVDGNRRRRLGRRGPQRPEHEAPGHGVRDGDEPVGIVRHGVERAGRAADDQVLRGPLRRRRDHAGDQRAGQPQHTEHRPGGHRAALGAHLLVQRHRVTPDQRGLQPAQAEAVRVDLVTRGRVERELRRHPPDASRAGPPPGPVGKRRGDLH